MPHLLRCLLAASICLLAISSPALAQYNFGRVEIGQSKTIPIYCFFTTSPPGGTETVTQDGIIGPNAANFLKSNDAVLGTHLDGDMATVDITFRPTARGLATATFSASAYDTIGGQNFPGFLAAARLQGTGILPEFGTGPVLCVAVGCALTLALRRRKNSKGCA